jgi:hypothetical protein
MRPAPKRISVGKFQFPLSFMVSLYSAPRDA